MKKNFRNLFLIFLLFSNSFLHAEIYKERAVVSYYAEDFHGKKTSNGETFSMYKLTCASKTLPFNTILKVTNLANGKTVQVRVNDRGPFVAGRELDLSKAAAIQLDMIKTGTANVKIEIVQMGPNTKLSQQTAASAAKIMAKKTGNKSAAEVQKTPAKKAVYSSDKQYDIQMGAFSSKDNAKKLAARLKKDGFTDIVLQTTNNSVVRVVIKAVPGNKVEAMKSKLTKKGYKDFQVKERKK